jgi:hypothetical protein
MLGLLIAAGSIAGYCWSRTVGMPGMSVEEWFTPYGVTALIVEGVFIVLVLFCPWRAQSAAIALFNSSLRGYVTPFVSLVLVVAVGFSTQQWDEAYQETYGHHVGSLSQVCSTPPTTFAQLEENYGVQISLAATSMMGNIVDVRLKVIDTEKAHALLQNQAALLVNQQALILAPHMHSHNGGRLKAGKIFTIFFPAQKIITSGSQVSLVFGPVRVEPVTVR